jgi:hypothetical protein
LPLTRIDPLAPPRKPAARRKRSKPGTRRGCAGPNFDPANKSAKVRCRELISKIPPRPWQRGEGWGASGFRGACSRRQRSCMQAGAHCSEGNRSAFS